jgi:hypothetical protein
VPSLIQLSDAEIDSLIREQKNTPASLFPLRLIERSKQRKKDYQVSSLSGNEFVIAVRQAALNPFNFSVILMYRVPGYTTLFHLCRYNGKHGSHTNEIERDKIGDECHIHTATERYQKLGGKEEGFAVETSRYSDLNGALRCLLEDCGFSPPPPDPQGQLFIGAKQ